MDNALLNREIQEMNRRFLNLCIRASEAQLTGVCLKLNVSMPFLRTVRDLDSDQVEALIQTTRCLVQPAVDERAISHAVAIACPTTRSMFVASASQVKHAVA
jgi:hypothetical protein